MTVQQLMDILANIDPNKEVMLYERGMEYSTYRAPSIRLTAVVEETEHCRDAFDGTSYTTKVIVNARPKDTHASREILEIF